MADMNIRAEYSQAACQPVLPCMTEYMARNEYWAEEPDVVAELFRRAELGEAWAQYNAGKLCFEGHFVPPDDEKAEKWWKLAGEQGHAKAQWRLGELYASVDIQRTNVEDARGESYIEQAKFWLAKAARQGVVDAMAMLGSMETDPAEALNWFRMGAEHGDLDCMYASGELCIEGRGVDRNGAEAVKWFRLAAERGHKGAPYRLGRIFEERAVVAQDFAEAAKYYRLGAEMGHPGCQFLLGKMLVEGRGLPIDNVEAERLLDKVSLRVPAALDLLVKIGAIDRWEKDYDDRRLEECVDEVALLLPQAEEGDPAAQFELGEIYRRKSIRKQAVEWHWRAASQGWEDSKEMLLEMGGNLWLSRSCFGDIKNWVRSLADGGNAKAQYVVAHFESGYCANGKLSQKYKDWIKKSAEQGYPEAQYKFAGICGGGDECEFDWYLKAALSGHLDAQTQVAECYFEGRGTARNLDAALDWAQRAVMGAKTGEFSNICTAMTLLGKIYEAQNTAEGDRKAVACYSDEKLESWSDASFGLGRMYEAGRGVERDYEKATAEYIEALRFELRPDASRLHCYYKTYCCIKWLSKTDLESVKQEAEKGNSNAQAEYGIHQYRLDGWDPENDSEVAKWFRLSAEQGNPLGQVCLGRLICSASGSWNHPTAMRLFRSAARSGLAEAQTAIAQHYRERADYSVAVRWYRLAAEQGEYAALLAMGEMCLNGEGVPQDVVAAAKWFRTALEWDDDAWFNRTCSLVKWGIIPENEV